MQLKDQLYPCYDIDILGDSCYNNKRKLYRPKMYEGGIHMKFMIFIVVIILIVVLRKRVVRFFKKNLTLKEVLIPNYGGEGPLWGPMVSPDEANNGGVFYWGRAFRRAAYLSGRDGHDQESGLPYPSLYRE